MGMGMLRNKVRSTAVGESAGRVVGENAVSRLVRLIDRFNDRFADPEVEGMENIYLRLGRSGRGTISSGEDAHLLRFESTEDLLEFLGSSTAAQVRAIRENA